MNLRVRRVDTIHLGGFEHEIRANLDATQASR
jgi:hypothetical protein